MKDHALEPPLARLDHVGVVVADLASACELMEKLFGMRPSRTVDVESKHLTAAFFDFGGLAIEFIEARQAGARAQRLGGEAIARIEHIAVRVDDLTAAVNHFRTAGVEMTEAEPLEAGGRRSQWTKPASSGGVMFQLCELA